MKKLFFFLEGNQFCLRVDVAYVPNKKTETQIKQIKSKQEWLWYSSSICLRVFTLCITLACSKLKGRDFQLKGTYIFRRPIAKHQASNGS